MQRVLEKMAKQLNNYDEASLMQLWQHYAQRVRDFEPTRRWEEAAIALCLVQSIHWKNQLFNYHVAASAAPADRDALPPLPDCFSAHRAKSASGSKEDMPAPPRATILAFPGKDKKDASSPNEVQGLSDHPVSDE